MESPEELVRGGIALGDGNCSDTMTDDDARHKVLLVFGFRTAKTLKRTEVKVPFPTIDIVIVLVYGLYGRVLT